MGLITKTIQKNFGFATGSEPYPADRSAMHTRPAGPQVAYVGPPQRPRDTVPQSNFVTSPPPRGIVSLGGNGPGQGPNHPPSIQEGWRPMGGNTDPNWARQQQQTSRPQDMHGHGPMPNVMAQPPIYVGQPGPDGSTWPALQSPPSHLIPTHNGSQSSTQEQWRPKGGNMDPNVVRERVKAKQLHGTPDPGAGLNPPAMRPQYFAMPKPADNTLSPLESAIMRGNSIAFGALLNTGTMNRTLDQTNAKGQTPLHFAAINGRAEMATALLDAKASPDIACRERGRTALSWASAFGKSETAKAILAFLDRPDIGLNKGNDALNHRDKHGMTPLMISAHNGQPSLEFFLSQVGRSPDSHSHIQAALNCANGKLQSLYKQQADYEKETPGLGASRVQQYYGEGAVARAESNQRLLSDAFVRSSALAAGNGGVGMTGGQFVRGGR
jgi:ankyrin repeat protein